MEVERKDLKDVKGVKNRGLYISKDGGFKFHQFELVYEDEVFLK